MEIFSSFSFGNYVFEVGWSPPKEALTYHNELDYSGKLRPSALRAIRGSNRVRLQVRSRPFFEVDYLPQDGQGL